MLFDFLILLVFAFIFYGACLHGEPVIDDKQVIFGNTDVRDGKWRNIPLLDFRGLSNLTLAATIRIYGLGNVIVDGKNTFIQSVNTFPLHVGNVLIHAINGTILLGILQQLGFDHGVSLVGALFYIGHPLAVSTTAYIAQRASLLSAMFGLMATYLVLSGYEWLAIPMVLLAMLSKEDAAILPVTFLLLAILRGTTMLPWMLMLSAIAIGVFVKKDRLRIRMSHSGSEEMAVYGYERQLEHPTYFLTAATESILRLPAWLLGLNLNIYPDIQVPSRVRIALAGFMAVLVVGLFFVVPPVIQIGLILTVISPLLVSWFIPLPDPIMEYRAYFALAGGMVLWVNLIDRLPWLVVTILVAWQWLLGAYRVFDWQTQLGIWLAAARDGSGDKPKVIANIGASYEAVGDFKTAEPYLMDAIERHPNLGMPLANLAYIRAQQRRLDEARVLLERCVEVCPKYERAWSMLHAAYHHLKNETGRLRCEEALAGFKK